MPSLGTGFGPPVPHICERTASGDLVAADAVGIDPEPAPTDTKRWWDGAPSLVGLTPGSVEWVIELALKQASPKA